MKRTHLMTATESRYGAREEYTLAELALGEARYQQLCEGMARRQSEKAARIAAAQAEQKAQKGAAA